MVDARSVSDNVKHAKQLKLTVSLVMMDITSKVIILAMRATINVKHAQGN